MIASVESPEDWGGLHPALTTAVGDAPVLRKVVFGLADDPLVGPALRATQRRTAILVGLETDVCVAHSALGLLDEGLRVVVVEDAVGSPGTAQLHYEWMRSVERSRAFRAAQPALQQPPGVVL